DGVWHWMGPPSRWRLTRRGSEPGTDLTRLYSSSHPPPFHLLDRTFVSRVAAMGETIHHARVDPPAAGVPGTLGESRISAWHPGEVAARVPWAAAAAGSGQMHPVLVAPLPAALPAALPSAPAL